ncbi:MAG: hypothetical protein J6S85_17320 [Methanobrevibacter sp.]|nr:hypothetical protein [Methanobrevibacter sp.]
MIITKGTNKFLPFASGSSANVITDTQYSTLLASGGALSEGFVQGLAKSAQVNKALRNSTCMTAGVGQWLANIGNDVDDSLTPDAIANMIHAGIVSTAQGNSDAFIQQWQQTVVDAMNGYPKYAVVADPNGSGTLYMSLSDNNTEQPNPMGSTNTWLCIPPSRIISVEAFGVVNDPSGENATANTTAFQNIVNAINNNYISFAIYIPYSYSLTLNGSFTFDQPAHLIVDGQVTFQNSGELNFYNTAILEGQGTIYDCTVTCSNNIVMKNIQLYQGGGVSLSDNNNIFINVTFSTYNVDVSFETNISSIYFYNCRFNGGIQGGSTSLSEIYFYNCTFTQGNGNNPLFDFTGTTVSQVLFSGCNFLNCELGAIVFNSQSSSSITTDISILDCFFDNNGQTEASSDIALYYCSAVTIKGCVFKNNSNSATNLTSGESIASVYVDATCNDILITDCMFSNIGQLNISGGSGYGIQANNVESLMVVKNTFRNAKAVMIAPCTGTLTQSGYVEGNIWNPQQFFNTTNVANNPQSNLGFIFNTVIDGFPSIINTDLIRKTFNLDKIGKDFNSGSGSTPNKTTTPKSIIARKTSLGWVAKQAVWIDLSNLVPGQSWGGLCYWLVPFQEVWIDTAQLAIYESAGIDGVLYSVPTIACNGDGAHNQLTTEGVGLQWYDVSGLITTVAAYNASFKIEVEGLVDIQQVINLTSINQYLPSSSS